jgi:nitroimidazol reductase NimA-like FMN-containing flavoprotein (pyridoxamine 5'-phosphate oxidase superfamily)
LALNGDDGYPYAVPITYRYLDNYIYFHSANHGYKIDILKRNTKASFSVILNVEVLPSKFSASFESIIATGDIVFVEDKIEKDKILIDLIDRYSSEYKEMGMKFVNGPIGEKTAVFKMKIKEITGKGKYS